MPEFLLEEGRLAAAAGDSAGAVRALRHYVALRDGTTMDADDWEAARQRLQSLVAGSR